MLTIRRKYGIVLSVIFIISIIISNIILNKFFYKNFKEYITRYDHSINVALITWKCTYSKEQTLAALFHDVATPCFSHVIDYMNKDYETQESTEEYTERIIKQDLLLLELKQFFHTQ